MRVRLSQIQIFTILMGCLLVFSFLGLLGFTTPAQARSSCAALFASSRDSTAGVSVSGASDFSRKTFIRMKEGHDRGESVPYSQVLEWLVEERNGSEVRERRRRFWSAVENACHRINEYAEKHWGRTVTAEGAFRAAYDRMLLNTEGDRIALGNAVNRERRKLVRALEASIEAELKYAKIYQEIYYLLRDLELSGRETTAGKMVQRVFEYDRLLSEVIQMEEAAMVQLRGGRLPVTEAEGHRYADLMVDLRERKRAFYALERSIDREFRKRERDLRKKGREKGKPFSAANLSESEALEYELARKWSVRLRWLEKSNDLLTVFFVANKKNQVLDSIIYGELGGILVPFDEGSLRKIERLLLTYGEELNQPRLFGAFYSEGEPALRPAGGDPYTSVRGMSRQWSEVWQGRIDRLGPKVSFRYLIANLLGGGWNLYQAWVAPTAMKRNLDHFWNRWWGPKRRELRIFDETLMERLSKELDLRPEDEGRARREMGEPALLELATELAKSTAGREEIDWVRANVTELETLSKAQLVEGEGRPFPLENWRSALGELRRYLDERRIQREELDLEVESLLAGPAGDPIYRLQVRFSERPDQGTVYYDEAVMQTIVLAKMKRREPYLSLEWDLARQLFTWGSGVAATTVGSYELLSSFW